MEMKVNSNLIKSERDKRAWSQQHLATVTGLGIRTIQRIESRGSASYESVKALASVLEREVEELRVHSQAIEFEESGTRKLKQALVGLMIFLLFIGIGVFSTTRISWANDISLIYAASLDDQDADEQGIDAVSSGEDLVDGGETSTISVGHYRVEVTPTIQQGGVQIALAVKIFEEIEGEYSLRAEPKVITANSQEATIQSQSQTGHKLTLILTPSIQ